MIKIQCVNQATHVPSTGCMQNTNILHLCSKVPNTRS